ncbi:YDG/SRA domain-containing protein [Thermomonospora cellulosilytica]|uniref:Putative restriction endonuclease n=1 Tax=Thermomonospora cellulosilytica TaxID=1411118 RepID=A0A7W3MX66_9ACTN|nr:YDG/SRA domain-containing protein [Thermomonospora cellulosilytica]MBA9003457.1 putative restriction endonuclease [Thermomonospora cellulosilytica]
MAYKRTFGHIPGHPEGSTYSSRKEVQAAGLHAHEQAGISGTAKQGADAIVLNGGYPDDRDYGDEIIYTGHGGQDPNTKKQIKHQDLNDWGNAALVRSQLEGLPVRVIRGFNGDKSYSPASGYRYDGLYRVAAHWFADHEADPRFRVCQFHLIKIKDEAEAGILVDQPIETSLEEDLAQKQGPAPHKQTTVNKAVRNAEVVRRVKEWHQHRCQVCGIILQVDAGPYSQGAHIRPLGLKHGGPDMESNMLCLCPNDHVRFDNGALYITDDLKVVNALTGEVIGPLRTHPRHKIDLDHVRYHRSQLRSIPES